MQRMRLAFLLVCCCIGIGLHAQTVPLGMNYQGIARDALGLPLANSSLSVRVSFTSSDDQPTIYYTENHNLSTDELGLFQLLIGYGESNQKSLLEVPWEKASIWMDVEIKTNASEDYQLASSAQVLSVPYAIHAQKTLEVKSEEGPALRSQSTRWLTSGNSATQSNVHYLGTRDGAQLSFKTNNEERVRLTETGQVNIISPADGPQENRESYPLVVEGSNQGIWIKINESRSSNNNFLTFRDPKGTQGRVEGQTTGEFFASSDFIRTTSFFTANAIILGIKVGIAVGEIAGFAASIFGVAGTAPTALEAASLIADGVAISVAYGNWLAQKLIQLGVSYSSGAGDFAEYMLRAPGVNPLQSGQIVGIKGGLVSLNTMDADHILVISTAPAVLGNAPQDTDRSAYEKIAFMGQVLVRVVGPVEIGDYILPSGNNDGNGVAVHPENLLSHEYKNIVGVAWEEAPNQPLNIINAAIGLNQNDLAQKTAELEWQINNITDFLEGKGPLSRNPENVDNIPSAELAGSGEGSYVISVEDYDQLLEKNEDLIKYHINKNFAELERQGYDIRGNEELQKYQEDPIGYLKKMRRTPSFEAQWNAMTAIIQEELLTKGR